MYNTICMGRTHEIAELSLLSSPGEISEIYFHIGISQGLPIAPRHAYTLGLQFPSLSAQLKVANEIGTELEWKYSPPRYCIVVWGTPCIAVRYVRLLQ